MILGIDEVGRGPWAGPLVVGAVVLGGAEIDGLTDSKKLSKKKRETLDVIIREQAAGWGLGWVQADELDAIGLGPALRLATRRAVEGIKVPYHEIIIDGTINFLADTTKGRYVTTMPKADLLVPSVSAASIIAKVARDHFMAQQDALFPGYNFASHVGYGTAAHRVAIELHGITPLHRLSFAPLVKYKDPQVVTTKKLGDAGETEAANHLLQLGYEIVERNWKTPQCEIDIVAKKDGTLYFVEVKYRRQDAQGGGIAAITKTKLHKMNFAAQMYHQFHRLGDINERLGVITVTGDDFAVEDFLLLE